MKVIEVMTRAPETCEPETDLATCARRMWDGDFGFLPVVGDRGEIVGVVTDRDLCMSAAMHDRRPSEILVREVMTRNVFACTTEDGTEKVLELMREHQVRRLPVLDAKGTLEGVVSLNDLALSAGEAQGRIGKTGSVAGSDVVTALKAISRHRSVVETG